jgi:hypothetical protein
VYKPDRREAAMLLLRAIEERGQRRGKPMTRVRVSRVTLKRLWNREQLTDPWLDEVNEWLLSAGWTLVYAGRTFGAVKTDVVENWPRIASKYLDPVIDEVKRGAFDFSQLERLLKSEQAKSTETASTASARRKSDDGSRGE